MYALPPAALMRQISVEIDGLQSVAKAMRDELESSLPHPGGTHPRRDAAGPIAGANWVALQDRYSGNIQATLDALFNLSTSRAAASLIRARWPRSVN
ncbi:hypothetical protein AB0M36_36815 [Actinoplanes sp. NPDC051346]|uniref:hypothetical protein n=1 Tax=Actinoplanes sp. NPDC051346 TaxID=3155048 RepID=UPI00342987D9